MSESQEGAETAVGSPVLEGAETAAEESPAQEDAEIAADSTLEDDDEDETFEDEPEQPDLDTAEMARMRAETRGFIVFIAVLLLKLFLYGISCVIR